MATLDYTAGDVMDTAAALNNDSDKQVYTYAVQLPYVKRAFRELREELELNNVPVTSRIAVLSGIVAGVTEIDFNTIPGLPEDLVEIRQLWERPTGIDPWLQMSRRETLPYYLDGIQSANFLMFSWQDNKIKLLATTQTNDLKIDYVSQLNDIVDENTIIGIVNGRSFLESRCAALCAQYIGEDKPRADDLNADGVMALDRLTMIESKAKQAIFTRRRPFRQAWKSRGVW